MSHSTNNNKNKKKHAKKKQQQQRGSNSNSQKAHTLKQVIIDCLMCVSVVRWCDKG